LKEWNDKYNPFNSIKVLMYREWLEGYAKEDYRPPVTVAIDTINDCNLKCIWCNGEDIIKKKTDKMTTTEAIKIAKFISEWGVLSTCIAGGGEPLMNKDAFNTLLLECHRHHISNSVITNGTLLDTESIGNIAETCRWIGFSVDAGSKETFKKLKKIDMFEKVLENIRLMRNQIDKTESKCEIAFKFVLHPDNQHEIVNAIKWAKKSGAHDFQLRPVATKEILNYDLKLINEQFKAGYLLQDRNFRVYGVTHKVDNELKSSFDFKYCRACSIHPVFCSDGTFQLCIDRRGEDSLTLCDWYPDPERILDYWNTDYHRKLLRDVNFDECPKCVFSEYNNIIEKVFIKDQMCRRHV